MTRPYMSRENATFNLVDYVYQQFHPQENVAGASTVIVHPESEFQLSEYVEMPETQVSKEANAEYQRHLQIVKEVGDHALLAS